MASSYLLLTIVFAILNLNQGNFVAPQSVTSCNQCRYGECETLQMNRLQCHCVTGVKGTYCDRLLENGEDLCLSSPCWNGGVCRSNGYSSYTCDCPAGCTGKDCRTISGSGQVTYPGGMTNAPVTQTAAPTTTQKVYFDKKATVLNKGGYTAELELVYYNPTRTVQKGTILSLQGYAFYIPGNIDYNTDPGVVLTAKAIGGKTIMSKRLTASPECFHVWGTTLNPVWSNVNC